MNPHPCMAPGESLGAINRSVDMHARLVDGWEGAVGQGLAPVRPLLANGTVAGVFVGDELVGDMGSADPPGGRGGRAPRAIGPLCNPCDCRDP